MRRHEHRLRQILQQLDEAAPRPRIKPSRRLIHHQNLWIHRKHSRNRNALLFPGTQVMRHALLIARHIHGGQRSRYAPAHLGLAQPHVQRPKRYILKHRRRKQLVIRVLKHKPHRSPHLAQGLVANLHVTHLHRATAAAEYSVQVQDQRGLARAIRPHQSHLLPRLDPQCYAIQRSVPVWIPVRKIMNLNGVVHTSPAPLRT